MSRWDIRVPVTVLHDPDYLRLSSDAFAALILLQCMSARDEVTDGFVPAKMYQPGPGYAGLPIVPPERLPGAIEEIQAAGLLDQTDDGVVVIWDHQTTKAQVDKRRADAAERQRAKRKRDRADNEDVTRDSL